MFSHSLTRHGHSASLLKRSNAASKALAAPCPLPSRRYTVCLANRDYTSEIQSKEAPMFHLRRWLVRWEGLSRSPHERCRSWPRVEQLESRTLLAIFPLAPATIRDWYGFNALSTTTGTNDGTGITIGIV